MCCGRSTPNKVQPNQPNAPVQQPQVRPSSPSGQVKNNRQLQLARNNAATQKRLQQQTADNIQKKYR